MFQVIVRGVIGDPLCGVATGLLTMFISDFHIRSEIWMIEASSDAAIVGMLGGLVWTRIKQRQ